MARELGQAFFFNVMWVVEWNNNYVCSDHHWSLSVSGLGNPFCLALSYILEFSFGSTSSPIHSVG